MVEKKFIKIGVVALAAVALVIGLSVGITQRNQRRTTASFGKIADSTDLSMYENTCESAMMSAKAEKGTGVSSSKAEKGAGVSSSKAEKGAGVSSSKAEKATGTASVSSGKADKGAATASISSGKADKGASVSSGKAEKSTTAAIKVRKYRVLHFGCPFHSNSSPHHNNIVRHYLWV